MHLVSHFCSALCAGVAASALLRDRTHGSLFTVPLLLGAGAVLPDIDSVSVLVSHQVFYASSWYSHRGMAHSPFGALLLAAAAATMAGSFRKGTAWLAPARPWLVRFTCLSLGALLHIVEDLPCPRDPWQGLMLLFPLSDHRFGGWGHIFWVNEFLMVLFSAGALASAGLLLFLQRRPKPRRAGPITGLLVGLDAAVLALALVFVTVSRYESPEQWQRHQERLMGPALYRAAKSLNQAVEPIWSRELL